MKNTKLNLIKIIKSGISRECHVSKASGVIHKKFLNEIPILEKFSAWFSIVPLFSFPKFINCKSWVKSCIPFPFSDICMIEFMVCRFR